MEGQGLNPGCFLRASAKTSDSSLRLIAKHKS
jgi:hypothetical protein